MKDSKNNFGTSDHIPTTPKKEAIKAANAVAAKSPNEAEIILSDGRVAKCLTAKGKHVMDAQRLMDGNAEKMLPALISVCTRINDRMLTIEELMEMPASDYMKLLGHYGVAFQ